MTHQCSDSMFYFFFHAYHSGLRQTMFVLRVIAIGWGVCAFWRRQRLSLCLTTTLFLGFVLGRWTYRRNEFMHQKYFWWARDSTERVPTCSSCMCRWCAGERIDRHSSVTVRKSRITGLRNPWLCSDTRLYLSFLASLVAITTTAFSFVPHWAYL